MPWSENQMTLKLSFSLAKYNKKLSAKKLSLRKDILT
jgi:hypothetical protein